PGWRRRDSSTRHTEPGTRADCSWPEPRLWHSRGHSHRRGSVARYPATRSPTRYSAARPSIRLLSTAGSLVGGLGPRFSSRPDRLRQTRRSIPSVVVTTEAGPPEHRTCTPAENGAVGGGPWRDRLVPGSSRSHPVRERRRGRDKRGNRQSGSCSLTSLG